jgi:hypothetical protein
MSGSESESAASDRDEESFQSFEEDKEQERVIVTRKPMKPFQITSSTMNILEHKDDGSEEDEKSERRV